MRNLFFSLYFLFLSTPLSVCLADEEISAPFFLNILPFAELSTAVYDDLSALKKVTNLHGLKPGELINIPDIDLSFVLVTDVIKKRQIVVIRGTANVDNAVTDMDIKLVEDKQTGVNIHKGFLEAGNSVYKVLKSKLNKDYDIVTTGHSLGGAVAVVLAMKMQADNFNVAEVITFGQPKVTNIGGANKYKTLNVWRIVRPKDIVPIVPPVDVMDINNIDIYWHIGKEIILNGNNEFSELEGVKSMLRSADFISTVPNQENIDSHKMSGYLALVKSDSVKAIKVDYKTSFNPMKLFGRQ